MTVRRLALGLFVLIALVAAGCGSDGEEVLSGSGDTAAPVDEATTIPVTTIVDDVALGAGPYPIATLDVEFTPDGGKALAYTISCLGDTATVIGDVGVNAESACLALNDDAVRTRLIGGVPSDRICTEIYGSADTASISGTIDDEPVMTEVNRANGCGIDDWDVVLAAVLPAITPS